MRKGFFCWCATIVVMTAMPSFAGGIFVELDSSQPWHITQKSDYVVESDVDAQDGNFSVGRTALSIKKEYKYPNGLPVDLTFSIAQYYLHDETTVDLPASLQSKGITLGTKMPMPFVTDDRFFIGLDTGAYFQTAKEHNFDSSAFRSKNRIYGIFKENDQFVFVAGGMYQTDYEDMALMPFVGFQYILNDQWSFHFLSDEPSVNYRLNERATVKWQFGAYRDEFEVVSGARKGEIVKITDLHTALGFDYEIREGITFQVSAGWAFNRSYEYLNDGGKVVPDNNFFFGYVFKMFF